MTGNLVIAVIHTSMARADCPKVLGLAHKAGKMSVSDLKKRAGNPFTNILEDLVKECPAEELTEDDFGKGWRRRSLCNEVNNPDLFFLKEQEMPSKVTCSVCSTRVECAIWALMYDEEGIWGGTNEKDRREFKKSHPVYIQALLDKARSLGKYFPRFEVTLPKKKAS